MLRQDHTRRNIVANIDSSKIVRIKDFMQGSIYCYCKNCKDSWFAARDLFGGDNFYWEGTPLFALHEWHENNGSSKPGEMAGKDIGWILLDVIIEDKRTFDLKEGYTHEYKLMGEEDNSNVNNQIQT